MTRLGRESTEDFGQRLTEAMQQNPIPAALVGMGIAWLFAGGNRTTISDLLGSSHGSEPSLSAASAVGSKLGDAASSTTEAVADVVSNLQQRGNSIAGTLQRDVSEVLNRQPLVLGAVGLVVGAAIGTAFQTTDLEQRLVGEKS